jgi:hypothetical protein
MDELAIIGEALLDTLVCAVLDNIYCECDLSTGKRSRKLSVKIDTDERNLTYEINLNFKSGPRWDGAIK